MPADIETINAEGVVNFSLKAECSVDYQVMFCDALFSRSNSALSDYLHKLNSEQPRVFVVIDHNIGLLYGQQIRDYFKYNNIVAAYYILEASEKTKSIDLVLDIIKHLDDFHLARRSEPLIAIGGGVVTDIVGLAASVYRRGVSYLRIPTTLIGLIDAGIGVKTGVNNLTKKNRIGSYYAPLAVFLDRNFLKTLDARLMVNGIAEIIKLALVCDSELFFLVEKHKQKLVEERFFGEQEFKLILSRSVSGMLAELAENIHEACLQRKVDFGHTFSPKIEMQEPDAIYHGEAVAIDMAFSVVLSQIRNLISVSERNRILNLLRDFKLPIYHQMCSPDFMMQALKETTINRDGLQRLPLIHGVGEVQFVNNINSAEVSRACDILQEFVSG